MKKSASKERAGVHNRKVGYMDIDKHDSVLGLVSIIVGIAAVVVLLGLFLLSYIQHGKAGIWIGLLGILLAFATVAGVVIAIFGLSDTEAKKGKPVLGIVLNAVLFSALVVLYIIGF